MRVGDDRILLVDPVAAALAELEQAADEVLAAEEEVPIPNQENPDPDERVPRPSVERGASTALPSGGATRDSERITQLDVFVGILAVVVLGVSLFGLFWLLGGQ